MNTEGRVPKAEPVPVADPADRILWDTEAVHGAQTTSKETLVGSTVGR